MALAAISTSGRVADYPSGDIQILLGVPATEVAFDWYVFDATSGADFGFTAYDDTATSSSRRAGMRASAAQATRSQTGPWAAAACRLVFSDDHMHDIGIDNLALVRPFRSPALMLSVVGVALARTIRRNRPGR